MAINVFAVGCCCGCTVGQDNFNRDDDSDIGGNWYKLTGDGTLSGNTLYITAADSIIRFERTYNGGQHVTVDLVDIASVLDFPRVYLDLVDDENFHYAEFDTGAMTCSLYKRTAAVNDLLATFEYPDALGTIEACISESKFRVDAGGEFFIAATSAHGGDYVALGCGALTGYVGFDNFVFSKVTNKCEQCGCTLCIDRFDRGDNSDIDAGSPCGWTIPSGTWDITTLQLRCTSAGVAICDTIPSLASAIVNVSFKHSNSAGHCYVIVGWVDSTHFFYADYDLGGSIDIRRVNGGSDTSVSTTGAVSATLSADTNYSASVCVDTGGTITAALDGTEKVSAFTQPVSTMQSGVGASGSGTATFDNWELALTTVEEGSACTPCNAMAFCSTCGEITAHSMLVVIGGILDGGSCPACAQHNSVWIVPFGNTDVYVDISGTSGVTTCYWYLYFDPIGCAVPPAREQCGIIVVLAATWNTDGSGNRQYVSWVLDVHESCCDFIPGCAAQVCAAHFRDSGSGAPPSCFDFSGRDVPVYAATCTIYCDPSGATCSLTLL